MSWDDGAPADGDWDGGSKPVKRNFDDGFSGGGAGFDDAPTACEDYGANGGGGSGDGCACRNCGEDGHFARECPQPKKNSEECYRCCESGHNKAGCTNEAIERAFTGACRTCGTEGHRAADCPEKKPEICHGCGAEGHRASECIVNRKIDHSKVDDMEKGKAWKLIQSAAANKDMADFKKAIDIYIKASRDITYVELEKQLRAADIPVYCIAQEMEIPQTLSLVNLQGRAGCKNVVGYFFSDIPKRKIFADGWPSSPQENLERLADAGVPMENFVPQCKNCKEMGHMSKACTQDKMEDPSAMAITCTNCGEEGHRLRDCKAERQKRDGARKDCRRCGEAKTVPITRVAAAMGEPATIVETRIISPEIVLSHANKFVGTATKRGIYPKNATNPETWTTSTCPNFQKMGHFFKECPEPRDWSKVKCSQCGEMGHTIVRCKNLPAADNDGGMNIGMTSTGGMDDFDSSAAPVAADDW